MAGGSRADRSGQKEGPVMEGVIANGCCGRRIEGTDRQYVPTK